MGQNANLAHPLMKGCEAEMKFYKCIPQPGFEKSMDFHMSWVLLCLENGLHAYNQQQHELAQKQNANQQQGQYLAFTAGCQHEMITHRGMMVQEFRMSPELVMGCAQEIDKFCSPHGDIEKEGRTIHCLMEHAKARDPQKVIGPQCKSYYLLFRTSKITLVC